MFRIVSAAAIVILAAPPAGAQGDPEVGRELARTWCTSCHVVDIEGQGADVGPALPALLDDGQRTADELRGWLAAPHPPMPDFDLSRQEIEDIVAYLRKSGAMSHTATTERRRRTTSGTRGRPMTLSAREAELLGWLESQYQPMVELLGRLVDTDSGLVRQGRRRPRRRDHPPPPDGHAASRARR